jgi:hypothetical protein
MVTCKKCGVAINPNAPFCSSCGTAQPANAGAASSSVSPSTAVAYAPAPSLAPKKGNKVLKVIGIIVAIFVGFGIWGSFLSSKHTQPGTASATSGSHTYANPFEESHQMCAEIKQHVDAALQDGIKGVQCVSGKEDDGTLGLGIGYPAPALVNDSARKDAMFIAIGAAGEVMSDHANVLIGKVYVLDSTGTTFAVPGSLVRQVYEKAGNKEWSISESSEQIARYAKRVKLPQMLH